MPRSARARRSAGLGRSWWLRAVCPGEAAGAAQRVGQPVPAGFVASAPGIPAAVTNTGTEDPCTIGTAWLAAPNLELAT